MQYHTHTQTHVILSSTFQTVSSCHLLGARRSKCIVTTPLVSFAYHAGVMQQHGPRSAREVGRSDTVKFIARIRIYSVYSFRFYPFLLAGWFFLFFFFSSDHGGQHAFSISTPTCRSSPAKRDDDARRDWSTRLTIRLDIRLVSRKCKNTVIRSLYSTCCFVCARRGQTILRRSKKILVTAAPKIWIFFFFFYFEYSAKFTLYSYMKYTI